MESNNSLLLEFEERGDGVSEGVSYARHETADGHEGRGQHGQEGAPDSNAGHDADHHNGNYQHSDAYLRTGNKVRCRLIYIINKEQVW